MANTALTALGMWLLKIPGIGLLSLFVFICSFIPIAGVFISTAPIAFVAVTEYGFLQVQTLKISLRKLPPTPPPDCLSTVSSECDFGCACCCSAHRSIQGDELSICTALTTLYFCTILQFCNLTNPQAMSLKTLPSGNALLLATGLQQSISLSKHFQQQSQKQ